MRIFYKQQSKRLSEFHENSKLEELGRQDLKVFTN